MNMRLQLVISALLVSGLASGSRVLLAAEAPASKPADEADLSGKRRPPSGLRSRMGNERPAVRGRPGRMGRGPAAERPGAGPAAGESSLTAEQIDRLMELLKRHFPAMHARLAIARENNPQVFERLIHRAARSMLPMVRAAMEDPDLADQMAREHQAQMNVQQLRERYKRTTDLTQQTRIREEMRHEMEQAFESRLERLRGEIKRLQQRLDRARQELTAQESDKDKLIDDRLSHMLSENRSTP